MRNRLWLVLRIGSGITRPNLLVSDSNTLSTNNLIDDVCVDYEPSCAPLKTLMRGESGVLVGQKGNKLVLVTDMYGVQPVFSYRISDKCYFFTHFSDLVAAIPNLSLTPDLAGIW